MGQCACRSHASDVDSTGSGDSGRYGHGGLVGPRAGDYSGPPASAAGLKRGVTWAEQPRLLGDANKAAGAPAGAPYMYSDEIEIFCDAVDWSGSPEWRAGDDPGDPAAVAPPARLESPSGARRLFLDIGDDRGGEEPTSSSPSSSSAALPSSRGPGDPWPRFAEPRKLEALRRLALPACECAEDVAFLDEPTTLPRYLTAREGSSRRAAMLLKEAIAWRRRWRPHRVGYDEMAIHFKSGKMYSRGSDRAGRPIIYFKPRRDIDDMPGVPPEHKVLFFSWVIELALRRAPPGIYQTTWLVDMSSYNPIGFREMGRARLASALLSTLQTAYPERVAKIVIVSPPWFMSAFFAVIKPILSQRTLDKISMVNAAKRPGSAPPSPAAAAAARGSPASPTPAAGPSISSPMYYPDLEVLVAPEQLETSLGGLLSEPDFARPPPECALPAGI